MDGHIKQILLFIHNNFKKRMKPVDYYKLLSRLVMVLSVELDERPKEIEHKKETK